MTSLAMFGHFPCVLNLMFHTLFMISIIMPSLNSICLYNAFNVTTNDNLITMHFDPFSPLKELFFRLSCPHTSPHNGKAERGIHTINDIMHKLLFHAKLKPCYLVDATHIAD
jgi:hypothetical protein